jgi:RNA polymerase sigma-70 factor (ECF subfamily)
MSISEGRQQAERAIRSSRRSRRDTSSSGHVPSRSGATPPNCVDSSAERLRGPSDAVSRDRLVYAVYGARESEPAYPLRHASCEPSTDRRFVGEDVSDEMLLKHVAKGDKAAMHIMFARHRERVFRFIQRIVRNPAIVDDLVSQVFLDVWRSANRFAGRARVSTWLLSIARFKAINSWRERTHEDIDQGDSLEIVDAGDAPDVALDRKETQGILRACIDRLSPAHREIIDLLYYREKSVADVSEMIGIPQATVKSRIFYARKRLAGILVSEGLEAAPAGTNVGLSSTHAPSKLPPAIFADSSCNLSTVRTTPLLP